MVMHGLLDKRLRLWAGRKLAEIHDEDDRVFYRKLPYPAQDELFRVMVEIPLAEGRRVAYPGLSVVLVAECPTDELVFRTS
jgi:hypothetical protein